MLLRAVDAAVPRQALKATPRGAWIMQNNAAPGNVTIAVGGNVLVCGLSTEVPAGRLRAVTGPPACGNRADERCDLGDLAGIAVQRTAL